MLQGLDLVPSLPGWQPHVSDSLGNGGGTVIVNDGSLSPSLQVFNVSTRLGGLG